MASMKKTITAAPQITGEEAGKVILEDLVIWAKNISENKPPEQGRRTREQLIRMLEGIRTNEDSRTYSDYKSLQKLLHLKYTYSDSMIEEIMSAWHEYTRELDMLALAAVHDDPLLDRFKPEEYLKRQTLADMRFKFMCAARRNSGYMAFLKLISRHIGLDFTSLGDELNIIRFDDAQERVEDVKTRLAQCGLPGSEELLEVVSKLEPLEMRPPVSAATMRKVRAALRLKKPLNERIEDIYDLMVYGRIM